MKPDRLGVDPNLSDASKIYKHWLRTFHNFIESISENSETPVNKLKPVSYTHLRAHET